MCFWELINLCNTSWVDLIVFPLLKRGTKLKLSPRVRLLPIFFYASGVLGKTCLKKQMSLGASFALHSTCTAWVGLFLSVSFLPAGFQGSRLQLNSPNWIPLPRENTTSRSSVQCWGWCRGSNCDSRLLFSLASVRCGYGRFPFSRGWSRWGAGLALHGEFVIGYGAVVVLSRVCATVCVLVLCSCCRCLYVVALIWIIGFLIDW